MEWYDPKSDFGIVSACAILSGNDKMEKIKGKRFASLYSSAKSFLPEDRPWIFDYREKVVAFSTENARRWILSLIHPEGASFQSLKGMDVRAIVAYAGQKMLASIVEDVQGLFLPLTRGKTWLSRLPLNEH